MTLLGPNYNTEMVVIGGNYGHYGFFLKLWCFHIERIF